MEEHYLVVPVALHDALVKAVFLDRGFDEEEADDAARFCRESALHGIRTHHAVKAMELDDHFGSVVGGCQPGAAIEECPTRFPGVRAWNANHKLGPSVAFRAMEVATDLADRYGVGIVSVDNAFHYLWGGGYVLEAARRGYLAYTHCTAARAEVVPYGGIHPTMGTNPHSWAFPTVEAIGFPILVDWATSIFSMGRIQVFRREGRSLPEGVALDRAGNPTIDAEAATSLLPFGRHKGYGLGLVNELVAALTGGSLPTRRGQFSDSGEKHASCFFFQVIHPEALSTGDFADGRTVDQNVRAVLGDILGHGNDACQLPGESEAVWRRGSSEYGGLLFTRREVESLNWFARRHGAILLPSDLPVVDWGNRPTRFQPNL